MVKKRGAWFTAGLSGGMVAGDPEKLIVITGDTIGEIDDQTGLTEETGLTGEECSSESPATIWAMPEPLKRKS